MSGYIAVVGAVNIDVGGRSFAPLTAGDSSPGRIRSALGGVGRVQPQQAAEARVLGRHAVALGARHPQASHLFAETVVFHERGAGREQCREPPYHVPGKPVGAVLDWVDGLGGHVGTAEQPQYEREDRAAESHYADSLCQNPSLIAGRTASD